MRLTNAQVLNFRCVEDSGDFSVGPVTCLVGKNESGKTSILHALEKLNPVDESHRATDRYRDYPRFKLSDYDDDEKLLITEWRLEKADLEAVEKELGKDAVTDDTVEVTLEYGGVKRISVHLDDAKVIAHLVSEAGCDASEQQALRQCKHADQLFQVASALANPPSERVKTLLGRLSAFREKSPTLRAIDLVAERMPKFLYFSNYDRMRGAVALTDLHTRKAQNKLTPDDHIFLSFLEFAGTNIDEVVQLQQYEPLKAKAEAAGISISRRIFKYWSQNKHLKVQFDVGPALPKDPAPFNTGMVVRTRILNTLHDMTVEFDNRSAGFVWFFSFLVLFSQVSKKHGKVIILLDEPGLTLHGKAQADLLRFIEAELEPHHQVLYTTHSPFMVPSRRLDCVRTVEDLVVTKDGEHEVLGTKVGDDVLSLDPDTVFPIQGALGYDISQSLFVGPDTLLVEGPSDLLYIQAFSSALHARKRTGLASRWIVCPSGGIDKVGAFISLFGGNKLHVAVLTDYASGQKGKVEQLKESKLLEGGHVLLATEFSGTAEADIEDLIGPELYLTLLNEMFSLTTKRKLTDAELRASGEKSTRIVKRVEAAMRTRTDLPEFDHFAPASWLIKNPGFLERSSPEIDAALDRFESMFAKVNGLLR